MTKELYEKYKKELENDKLPSFFRKPMENVVKMYEEQMKKGTRK